MLNLLNFLAEEGGSNLTSTIILIVMIVLVVGLLAGSFFMQRKQRKQADAAIKSLQVGDEIVTIGGVKGKIVAIDDANDTMDIETGNGVVLTFFKGAIQNIPAKQQPASQPATEDATAEVAENSTTAEASDEQAAEETTTTDEETKH